MFWPITSVGGMPNLRGDLMAVERYGTGDRIEKLLGSKEAIRTAVLQVDCLIEWHSFVSLASRYAGLEIFHTPIRLLVVESLIWFHETGECTNSY